MKTTQHERMYARITEHGENLKRLFGLPENTDLVKLAKRLRRWETKAHTWALEYCNGDIQPNEEEADEFEEAIIRGVRKVLGDMPVPVLFNKDPRGYALKIPYKWMRDNPRARLHTDWGGYGILCPEFDGKP